MNIQRWMKGIGWVSITLPMAFVIGAGVTAPVAEAQTLVAPEDAPENPGENAGESPSNLPEPTTTTTGGGDLTGDSILNGDLDSILNGDLDGILNGDLRSILNGDLGSILNGDLDGILNGDLDGILNGDLRSILNGDLGGILNSDLDGILNGDLDGILNGDLGSILNGDLGGILGGGGAEDILGDVLGGGGAEDILGGDLDGILNGGIGGDLGDLIGGGGVLGGGGGGAEVNTRLPALGETLTNWNTLAGEASGALLDNVVASFGSAPNIVTGALGVPDVLASQLSVMETVMGGVENGSPGATSQGVDRFNVNPVALSETIGKEVSRAASVGFSNTLLSEAGQQAIVEEVEATDETLAEITTLATEAQDLDVTQDVMKNLSAMLAQQSSIDVASYGQTIQLRQQFAADAVVQAEAAEDLAAMSRRQQTQPIAAAAEVLQSSSMLMLFNSEGEE